MFYFTFATVMGSFSILARRVMAPLGLLVCLFSGVVWADDGDDTLRFHLSKSDAAGKWDPSLIEGSFGMFRDAKTFREYLLANDSSG